MRARFCTHSPAITTAMAPCVARSSLPALRMQPTAARRTASADGAGAGGAILGPTVEAGGEPVHRAEQRVHLVADHRCAVGTGVPPVAELVGDHHQQVTRQQRLAAGGDQPTGGLRIEGGGASLVEEHVEGLAGTVARLHRLPSHP